VKKKLFFITAAFVLLLLANKFSKYGKKAVDWQYYVEKNIGSKSVYQAGNNIYFDDNYIVFSDQQNTTYALDKNNAEEKWIFKGQNYSPYEINTLNGNVYVSSFDAHIYKLDGKNGYPLWCFAIPDQIVPDSGVIADENDRSVFFADRAGWLYALDKDRGTINWRKKYKGPDLAVPILINPIHFGFITQDEDYLYIKNYQQKEFTIIAKKNGDEIFNLSKYVPNKIPITFFEEILLIARSPNEYIAVDRSNYSTIWSIKGKTADSLPQIYKDRKDKEHFLYFDKDLINKIDNKSGRVLWSYKTGSNARVHSVDSSSDIILLEDEDLSKIGSKLKVISWQGGEEKWKTDIPPGVRELLIRDNYFVVSTNTNDLILIDSTTKEMVRQFKLLAPVSKLLVFKDKIVVVTIDSGSKAIIYCLDLNKKEFLWVYKSEQTISPQEVYQKDGRLYFLNKDNFIIQSIEINDQPPKSIIKANFDFIENFSIDAPKIDYRYKKAKFLDILKERGRKYYYLFNNIRNIFKFDFRQDQVDNNDYEIVINHDQNLYRNYFTDIEINAMFTNNENEKILVKGFYYDFNTWKVKFVNNRNSEWKWKITIDTPYYRINKSGVLATAPGKISGDLTIKGDTMLTENNKVFLPIGIQECIVDRNYDGNPLNQMGNAEKYQPEIKEESFRYLTFPSHLDLYKIEANMNTYRIGIDNCGPVLLRDLAPKDFSINVNDAKYLDFMIKELIKRDYKIILTIFGFYPPYQNIDKFADKESKEVITKYLDYIIARYAPYVDIWEISNEASTPLEWQNFMSGYITRNDTFHHPITTSWEQKQLQNSELISLHWYSPIKTDVFSLEKEFALFEKKYDDWEKTIIISEFGFKKFSFSENTPKSMRIYTWLSIFNKMGIIYWSQPFRINTSEDNANIYLGPKERRYIKNLQNFLPSMNDSVNKANTHYDQEKIDVYLLENDKYLLAYLLNRNNGIQYNKSINLEIKDYGYLELYNPEYGYIIQKYRVSPGKQKILIPQIFEDLALKISYRKNVNAN